MDASDGAPTDALYVDAVGNVGIGRTNSMAKLDVQGNIFSGNGGMYSTGRVYIADNQYYDYTDTRYEAASPGSSNRIELYYNEGIKFFNSPSVSGDAPVVSNEAMRIDTSGNVGIGKTSPENKLDVEGGVAVGATYSGTSTAPSDGMIVEGNVGIGTTSPGGLLHLYSTTATDDSPQLIIENEAEARYFPSILFKADDLGVGGGNFTVGKIKAGFDSSNLWDVTKMIFQVPTSGGILEDTLVLNYGNVGIGTASPGAKLEVSGQVKITGGTPGAGKVLTSDAAGLVTWESLPSADNLGNHTPAQNVVLGSNYLSGDGGNEGIYVDGSGNVGIGTTSLSLGSKLTIDSTDVYAPLSLRRTDATPTNGDVVGELRFEAPDSIGINTHYADISAFSTNVVDGSEEGQLDFYTRSGGAQGARITIKGSNVGIGTVTPQNKLDVEGSVAIGAAYSGASAAPANGLIVEGTVGIGTGSPVGYMGGWQILLWEQPGQPIIMA